MPENRIANQRRLPFWLRLAAFFIIGCGAVTLLFTALLYFGQHSFIYHPRPYGSDYPYLLPKDGVEIEYKMPFGKQTAFYIPRSDGSPKRIWVAFCGNGSLALDWTGLIRDYPQNGDGFLLIDYPGYGKNAGYATIASTRVSADAALHELALRLHLDESRIPLCVLGHSLGSAAALDFAVHHRVEKVVLVAPFTSLREEVATVVGRYFARVLIENYDNRENLDTIYGGNPQVRVVIFHGTDDGDIPVRMSRALAKQFPKIEFREVADSDHMTVLEKARESMITTMAHP